jgi:hypothetical protein
VKATNIFMGDLQRSLVVMLGDKGCDAGLLKDANGFPIDKQEFMFSPTDKMILRQYECGSEPVVLLSKFFQLNVSTSHLVLVHLRARIAQLREPKFAMFADISHLNQESLTARTKTEMVLSDDVTDREEHGRVESMQPCVNRFRLLCAEDLELRCGLVRRLETDRTFMEDVPEIPSDIAVACLLNPLVGGKSHSLSCGCCLVVAVLCLLSSWCLSSYCRRCGCCCIC